ncbi:uncharacterized protein ACLA_030220 [Aspergillus clavatus NRRL 1]|uniref:Uncharacterized protein n=1 Tax=Aspergillus clavatus (strain ATCC 1007 / CBS 513.65 / DSM 816 / NCTC 3887 / NRRL 1 / QM 1276 / 107) TaxID=344612 RepID=A1CRL8_ASPCL|nr:uncharacterized protein ACLA_030220 [Aspergillus clavatus NRRL 1]EAW08289.1 hypothetical protein ACLA_030220 [Aspergillus clavatus NRRL 1]
MTWGIDAFCGVLVEFGSCVPQAEKWRLLVALRVQQPQQRRALAAAISDIQAAMARAAGDSDSDAEFVDAPAAADALRENDRISEHLTE